MKKSLVSIIIAAVLLVAVIGTVIGVVVYANTPKVIVRNALAGTAEDLAKRDEVQPLLNTLEKGSLEIKGTMDLEDGGYLTQDLSFGGKLYFSEKALMMENVNVGWDDRSYSADAYFSKEKIYVSSEDLLDGTYGLVHGDNSVELEDSFLADFMDEEALEQLQSFLDSYHEQNLDKQEKKAQKILDDYSKFLVKSIEEVAEYEKETKKVKVGGERINARVVTVKIASEDLATILDDLYEKIQDDDDLKELIDPDDQMFDDLLDEMEPVIQNIVDGLEDYDMTLIAEVVTPKSSSKLLQLSVSTKIEKTTTDLFTLDLGEKGIAKTDRIELVVMDSMNIAYEIKENTSSLYKATVKASLGSWSDVTVEIKLDQKKDNFEISIKSNDDDKIVLSGDYKKSGKTRELTWDELRVGSESYDGFSLTLIAKEKDSMPKPVANKEVESILALEDIETVMENFENIFENPNATPLSGKTYESSVIGTGTSLAFGDDTVEITMTVMNEVLASETMEYSITTDATGAMQIRFAFDKDSADEMLATSFASPSSLEIGDDSIKIGNQTYNLTEVTGSFGW